MRWFTRIASLNTWKQESLANIFNVVLCWHI